MTTNIIVHTQDESRLFVPKPAVPPREGIYAVVLTSVEFYRRSRPTQNEWEHDKPIAPGNIALPDVWRIAPRTLTFADGKRKPDFVSMTEDIQHWIFRMIVEKHRGKPFANEQEYRTWWAGLARDDLYIRWFGSLFKDDRSHTNGAGVNICKNFIARTNLDADYPKFFHLVTGRAILKLISLEVRNVGGNPCYGFECINVSKGYRQFNPADHPHLFDEPLMTGRIPEFSSSGFFTGRLIRDDLLLPYPQFEPTRPIFPIMLPFDYVAWIPVYWVRILDPFEPLPRKYV